MDEHIVPPDFQAEMQQRLRDALDDMAEMRYVYYGWQPPTRWQQFKTCVKAFRERLAKRLFEVVSGHEFPDSDWP